MNGDVPHKNKQGRKRCRCRDICRRGQAMRALFRKGDLSVEARKFIRSLVNDLCCTEDDVDYCRAILDGSWPTAVEQLTKALELAKAKEALWKR